MTDREGDGLVGGEPIPRAERRLSISGLSTGEMGEPGRLGLPAGKDECSWGSPTLGISFCAGWNSGAVDESGVGDVRDAVPLGTNWRGAL